MQRRVCVIVISLVMDGASAMQRREEELTDLGLRTLRAHPRIALLGDTGGKRLPIFSFLVGTDDGR